MLTDTDGKVLARRVVRFRNAWTQSMGLMFREPRPGTAYVFDFGREVRYGFHMWFVFWPIDVHFLDEQKRAVESRYRFLPFRRHLPRLRFRYAVELRSPGPRLRPGTRLRF